MPRPDRLTYAPVGATRPAERIWADRPPGFLAHESTVVVGRGTAVWEETARRVLRWGVKTASGFGVEPADVVVAGTDCRVWVRVGPFRVVEPVRVLEVVEDAGRVGFAYGTLPGHPVSGEEAFVVHRAEDGVVRLTLRSLTRTSTTRSWALVFPALLVAQRVVRRRYRRALRPAAPRGGP